MTAYRCPIGAANCPEVAVPGYCTTHPTALLVAVRDEVVAAPEPVATHQEPVARPQLELRLLGRSVPIPPTGLLVGREEEPLSSIDGMRELTQVSRTHAQLYWLADKLYVEDRDSTNGTYVDGVRVRSRRRLEPGQQLRLGLDVLVEVRAVEVDEFGLPS